MLLIRKEDFEVIIIIFKFEIKKNIGDFENVWIFDWMFLIVVYEWIFNWFFGVKKDISVRVVFIFWKFLSWSNFFLILRKKCVNLELLRLK